MQKSYIYKLIVIVFVIGLVMINLPSFSLATEKSDKLTMTCIIKNVYNKTSNTFTYKLEAGDDKTKAILAEPKTFDVVFDNLMPNDNNLAIKTYDIDFSDINFTQSGYYKFVISEVSSSNETLFPKSDEKYEITVYVSFSGGKTVIEPMKQVFDFKTNAKTDLKFNHDSILTYIHIENYLDGKMVEQDRNVYFKYKIQIFGNVGDRYVITGQDKEVIFDGQRITTQDYYEVKEGSDNFVYVYLKHDQKIKIGLTYDNLSQIPVNTRVALGKIGAKKWNTHINTKEEKNMNYFTTKPNAEDNLLIVINERDFDVALTGVFIDTLPFIVVIVISVAGVIYFIFRKKKNDDE